MLNNFFYNPSGFDYVTDSILWLKIFVNPFPRDLSNPSAGSINLNKYFILKEIKYLTQKGYELRKAIVSRKKFYLVSKTERNIAFLTLCQFLVHFNRPYRNCVMQIPRHPDVKEDKEFHPMDIYYKEPEYPSIDKDRNMFRIKFNDELYSEVYKYTFGNGIQIPNKSRVISYSFTCFCGFVLQY